jgi:hypothetical protein
MQVPARAHVRNYSAKPGLWILKMMQNPGTLYKVKFTQPKLRNLLYPVPDPDDVVEFPDACSLLCDLHALQTEV